MDYVSVFTNKEHLDRHFSGSLIPGSKFFPLDENQKQIMLDNVETRLKDAFDGFIAEGKEPSRIVLKIEFDHAIGTDALVEIKDHSKFIEVIREPGTEFETKVKVSESRVVPQTNVMTVIAGPYGPTGKWGIYTLFPSEDEGLPFPNPQRQKPEALQASILYWEIHGFLATPEEMAHIMASQPSVLSASAVIAPAPI